MLASEVLATARTVLYPVEFAMEFRIEQEDVASIPHYLLPVKTRTRKVILCRKDFSCTPFAVLQTLWIANMFRLPTGIRVINLIVKRQPYDNGRKPQLEG